VKNYQVIEHTADIALRVRAKDLAGLFSNAALALSEISVGKIPAKGPLKKESLSIKQNADTLDELFVNWLNELLSLSSAKSLIFTGFKIKNISEGSIEAEAEALDNASYRIEKEIKAATYHDLKIQKLAGGWQAEVILDV
jgi:SHS2 domain-containing protein